MADLFFTRACLRRDASVNALAEIFLPQGNDQRVTVTHKLLWTLFADTPERKRDFLWREGGPGLFFILSARPPTDEHKLFDIDPVKPFKPALVVGDRLAFSLRANPTVAIKAEKNAKGRSKRADVVMKTIKSMPPDMRAEARPIAVQNAGVAWLVAQGNRHGFAVEKARVDRYDLLSLPHRRATMRIATLDFDGILQVTDPEKILSALEHGLGRAKAYGCGLMLIRRA